MLTVVCWKWKPINPHFRSKFSAEHVNTFARMVARNFHEPHEVVCVTDDPTGIDSSIRVVPLWDDFRTIPSPLGIEYPACYSRVRAFSRDMRDILGPRFISVDLDCVITGDVTEIWTRDEDFVIWENNTRPMVTSGAQKPVTPYNGSMWMMNAGAREQVYTDFDPVMTPYDTHNAGYVGSDQAWFALRLGPDEARWTAEDNVYAWRSHLKNRSYRLPLEARIVFFQGQEDPWDPSAVAKAPWIKEHYR